MKKINIKNIINEEINKFDFLNNDETTKENENYDLVSNKDFQKQFICDFLTGKKDKIKISIEESKVTGYDKFNDYEDLTSINLTYFTDIKYNYDQKKEPINFTIDFYGDISVNVVDYNGDYYFGSINWNDVNVNLYYKGDQIDFIEFKKAPENIKNLFVREFVGLFIQEYTNIYINKNDISTNISNFC